MTTFIYALKINAANPLQGIWPRTSVTTGGRVALLRALLSVNNRIPRSELAKLTVLATLEKVFVRVCRRWVMSKREGFHHVRSH